MKVIPRKRKKKLELQKPLLQVLIFFLGAEKKSLRRGVKEVQKALRKGEKGIMVFAGDVQPIDVMSHLPVLCEDKDVPYIYVRSKEELGIASHTKRPTCCVLIKKHKDFSDSFKECKAKIQPIVY